MRAGQASAAWFQLRLTGAWADEQAARITVARPLRPIAGGQGAGLNSLGRNLADGEIAVSLLDVPTKEAAYPVSDLKW